MHACLRLSSLNTDSFLTETVLRRFGPLLPNLWGELAGECLLCDLPITIDLKAGTSVVLGRALVVSAVRVAPSVVVEIVAVGTD